MIGGGQLARMTAQAAIALGQTLRVLAASRDESAAQVTPDVVLGEHTDLAALREAATGTHAVTFDHEHVPQEHLAALLADGANLQPPPHALLHAQDKLSMRRKLQGIGAPVPPFRGVDTVEDIEAFWAEQDGAVVVKATRGGYDGKGVWLPDTLDEARRLVAERLAAGTPLLAERRMDMTRELSAMVAVSPGGQGAAWPVVESVQRDGVCAVAIAPAPGIPDDLAAEAQSLALRIARELGVTGAMAVELFETVGPDGRPRISVNELAMRPHNTGHWTMDGCVTSQFEQHLRAVLDYPLGATTPTFPVTVMANVLGAPVTPTMGVDERVHLLFGRFPEARVHLYGKGERPGRKLGHVNIGGADVAEVRRRAELAAHWLSHAEWADGWDPHAVPAAD